jgi:hypothetical protein
MTDVVSLGVTSIIVPTPEQLARRNIDALLHPMRLDRAVAQ